MSKRKRFVGRYWLFAFDYYYPSGGVSDLLNTFNTVEEFRKIDLTWYDSRKYDVYQIFDTQTGRLKTFSNQDTDSLTSWVEENIK